MLGECVARGPESGHVTDIKEKYKSRVNIDCNFKIDINHTETGLFKYVSVMHVFDYILNIF